MNQGSIISRETKFHRIKDTDLTYTVCLYLQNPYEEENDATDFVTVFEPEPSVLDLVQLIATADILRQLGLIS